MTGARSSDESVTHSASDDIVTSSCEHKDKHSATTSAKRRADSPASDADTGGADGSASRKRASTGASPEVVTSGDAVRRGDAQEAEEEPLVCLNLKVPKVFRCQVESCGLDLSVEKVYYQRHRVCRKHLRMMSLQVDGRLSRFCQQCCRFQDVTDFDANKRSCRMQLIKHNERRRKGPNAGRSPRGGRGQDAAAAKDSNPPAAEVPAADPGQSLPLPLLCSALLSGLNANANAANGVADPRPAGDVALLQALGLTLPVGGGGLGQTLGLDMSPPAFQQLLGLANDGPSAFSLLNVLNSALNNNGGNAANNASNVGFNESLRAVLAAAAAGRTAPLLPLPPPPPSCGNDGGLLAASLGTGLDPACSAQLRLAVAQACLQLQRQQQQQQQQQQQLCEQLLSAALPALSAGCLATPPPAVSLPPAIIAAGGGGGDVGRREAASSQLSDGSLGAATAGGASVHGGSYVSPANSHRSSGQTAHLAMSGDDGAAVGGGHGFEAQQQRLWQRPSEACSGRYSQVQPSLPHHDFPKVKSQQPGARFAPGPTGFVTPPERRASPELANVRPAAAAAIAAHNIGSADPLRAVAPFQALGGGELAHLHDIAVRAMQQQQQQDKRARDAACEDAELKSLLGMKHPSPPGVRGMESVHAASRTVVADAATTASHHPQRPAAARHFADERRVPPADNGGVARFLPPGHSMAACFKELERGDSCAMSSSKYRRLDDIEGDADFRRRRDDHAVPPTRHGGGEGGGAATYQQALQRLVSAGGDSHLYAQALQQVMQLNEPMEVHGSGGNTQHASSRFGPYTSAGGRPVITFATPDLRDERGLAAPRRDDEPSLLLQALARGSGERGATVTTAPDQQAGRPAPSSHLISLDGAHVDLNSLSREQLLQALMSHLGTAPKSRTTVDQAPRGGADTQVTPYRPVQRDDPEARGVQQRGFDGGRTGSGGHAQVARFQRQSAPMLPVGRAADVHRHMPAVADVSVDLQGVCAAAAQSAAQYLNLNGHSSGVGGSQNVIVRVPAQTFLLQLQEGSGGGNGGSSTRLQLHPAPLPRGICKV